MSINPNEEFIKRAFLQDIKDLTEKAKSKAAPSSEFKLFIFGIFATAHS